MLPIAGMLPDVEKSGIGDRPKELHLLSSSGP